VSILSPLAPFLRITALICVFGASPLFAGMIERIWLTHQSTDPRALVVSWETDTPGDSHVDFGPTEKLGQTAGAAENVTLHHVEIPLTDGAPEYHYRVRSGAESSAIYRFKGYPKDILRVAVVADTGYVKRPWADAIVREDSHLLISAGDNVPALHTGQPVPRETTTAFSKLVARWPQLYRTTPWLPVLGNHDREIRPRGPKPPSEPVYDVEATAYREFFALPAPEWRWHFDLPGFGARFIALDMSHLQDDGTTWQTNHAFDRTSEQFTWYRELIAASPQPFVVTLYNERNSHVRGLEAGEWGRMIARSSLAITGFGYFAERAEVDGFTCYNTSVNGTGDKYPDPKSAFLKSEDNFVLLTFRREPVTLRVELKNLDGAVLDRKEFTPRARFP
jgi:hypothetical protein